MHRIIQGGNSSSGFNWGNVKGSLAELEVALKLESEGAQVIELGGKYCPQVNGRITGTAMDLDIITESTVVEVKDLPWATYSIDSITKELSKLGSRKLAAEAINKKFVIYSKEALPQSIVDWTIKKNVKTVIGW